MQPELITKSLQTRWICKEPLLAWACFAYTFYCRSDPVHAALVADEQHRVGASMVFAHLEDTGVDGKPWSKESTAELASQWREVRSAPMHNTHGPKLCIYPCTDAVDVRCWRADVRCEAWAVADRPAARMED